MQNKNIEYILCAANFYNDGQEHTHTVINKKLGFIICGHRHHNCIGTFAQMRGFPYSEESQLLQNTEIQGFLTNTNRFVDRQEGLKIAIEANQLKIGNQCNYKDLYSEDLW